MHIILTNDHYGRLIHAFKYMYLLDDQFYFVFTTPINFWHWPSSLSKGKIIFRLPLSICAPKSTAQHRDDFCHIKWRTKDILKNFFACLCCNFCSHQLVDQGVYSDHTIHGYYRIKLFILYCSATICLYQLILIPAYLHVPTSLSPPTLFLVRLPLLPGCGSSARDWGWYLPIGWYAAMLETTAWTSSLPSAAVVTSGLAAMAQQRSRDS